MHASNHFCCVEGCCARQDTVRRERCLDFCGDRTLRQGMRERLEVCVIFESEVRTFVGFNQGENLRGCGNGHLRRVRFADRRYWLAVGHKG